MSVCRRFRWIIFSTSIQDCFNCFLCMPADSITRFAVNVSRYQSHSRLTSSWRFLLLSSRGHWFSFVWAGYVLDFSSSEKSGLEWRRKPSMQFIYFNKFVSMSILFRSVWFYSIPFYSSLFHSVLLGLVCACVFATTCLSICIYVSAIGKVCA